ncbi:YeiH family protein [Geobacillus thermodenitrificans]|uniref:YeiH family protein n=1 Tax=Geobacillus thermodenitrificans TaxID=33940 RepID=UPI002E222859|nr:putative sulfate exporter family transporter [Geobacillus thermodenitrificans]MED3907544.1 putative sulfate exporter family transporter [Geobacillus thermodenitrificans]
MQIENIKTKVLLKKKKVNPLHTAKLKGYFQGVLLTGIIAFIATRLVVYPFFNIMGTMIIAILIGMLWKVLMGYELSAEKGISFSSKILLRIGIILLGVRLDISQIIGTGPLFLFIDLVVVTSTLAFMLLLVRTLKIDKYLGTLISVGTAICGAAAIMAISSLINSKNENNALAVAYIALFGTIGSLLYILTYQLVGMDPYKYGIFSGATLQELAHVIAASAPGGQTSSDTAMLVKLGRVALLVPVALVIAPFFPNKTKSNRFLRDIPIPWFIFGFLFMGIIGATGIIPKQLKDFIVFASTFLLTMAMAGLGLSTKFSEFKKTGWKPGLLGLIGFVFLINTAGWIVYLL